MRLSWSGRRKLLYTTVVAVVGVVAALWVYSAFFTSPPTCTDGVQDGNEQGVDCGGSCLLLCPNQVRAPLVLWSRAFQVAPGTYTAAAYIQNPNIGAQARQVAYSFQLFDDKNLLVTERDGVIDIPPVQTVPFIDPNINVGDRVVTKAIFAFSALPVWVHASELPKLHATNQLLASDASTLTATIQNDSAFDADHVSVEAVLFDGDGVARGASKTFINRITHHSSADVTFTWPGGVPHIVSAEITILPSI